MDSNDALKSDQEQGKRDVVTRRMFLKSAGRLGTLLAVGSGAIALDATAQTAQPIPPRRRFPDRSLRTPR